MDWYGISCLSPLPSFSLSLSSSNSDFVPVKRHNTNSPRDPGLKSFQSFCSVCSLTFSAVHPETQTEPLNPCSEVWLKAENFCKRDRSWKDLNKTMITYIALVLIVAVWISCTSTKMPQYQQGGPLLDCSDLSSRSQSSSGSEGRAHIHKWRGEKC